MGLIDRLKGIVGDIADEYNHSIRYYPPPLPPTPGVNAHADTHPAMSPGPAHVPDKGPWPLNPQTYTFTVILDGSGNGSISIGPQMVREHWQVDSASVSVSTNVKEATCSVGIGSTVLSAGSNFAQTQTGSTGDTCSLGRDIQVGQQVIAVWKGGDVGQTATMTLNGTRSIGITSQ